MLLYFCSFMADWLVIEPQILNLAHNKSEIERRVHSIIDKFAERGLRSLAVAYQVQFTQTRSICYIHTRSIFRRTGKHIGKQ